MSRALLGLAAIGLVAGCVEQAGVCGTDDVPVALGQYALAPDQHPLFPNGASVEVRADVVVVDYIDEEGRDVQVLMDVVDRTF